MYTQAEYIWIDGAKPTQTLRSKTRILKLDSSQPATLDVFPDWSFDGSSTEQAEGSSSDCLLKPVNFVKDPIRGDGNFLVMCEVLNVDSTPHISNTRAVLRSVLDAGGAAEEPWVGFEQEYTLFDGPRPLGFPAEGFPEAQGPYYCGVGAERVIGRELIEAHTKACLEADIMIYGVNAEVMPGQWEFQIGYRGIEGESADPLNASDHLWFGRWLLYRLGEQYGVEVSIVPKPVKGDWNGAGNHTNFSTKSMRDSATGKETIATALKRLEENHADHIEVYGHGLDERLTGLHETCHISEFRSGQADRGASIRIPPATAANGYGYIEDRRPAANVDPYTVCAKLVGTVVGIKLKGAEPKLKVAAA